MIPFGTVHATLIFTSGRSQDNSLTARTWNGFLASWSPDCTVLKGEGIDAGIVHDLDTTQDLFGIILR